LERRKRKHRLWLPVRGRSGRRQGQNILHEGREGRNEGGREGRRPVNNEEGKNTEK
jgi:hypothetical protein